jgi:hypothetical protein
MTLSRQHLAVRSVEFESISGQISCAVAFTWNLNQLHRRQEPIEPTLKWRKYRYLRLFLAYAGYKGPMVHVE